MRNLTLCLALCSFLLSFGQEVKFGKISKEALAEVAHPIEPDSDAAVLYKYRRSVFEYDSNEGWQVVTEIQMRIKIYTKEGLDWGTHNQYLRVFGNDEEQLFGLKAYTYNLVGGKVQSSKLKKSGVFKEKTSKYLKKQSWTMPDVKEGSIIEFKYSIRSNSYLIEDVIAQYDIPLNKVEVKIQIPEYFYFRRFSKGFFPIRFSESKRSKKQEITYRTTDGSYGNRLSQSNRGTLEYQETEYKIMADNVPALLEEAYVNNMGNYRTSLVFELAQYRPPRGTLKNFATSWVDVSKSIQKFESFGGQLKKTNAFKKQAMEAVGASTDAYEKTALIFEHVKNHMTWNKYNGFTSESGIKKAYKEGKGNVGDINLLLVTMLRAAGIEADPVLVSTRANGVPLFPTRDGFNYVIAAVNNGNGILLLDATNKNNVPGILLTKTINWKGRMLRDNGSSMEISLTPNYLSNRSTMGQITLADDGAISGKIRRSYTKNKALGFRIQNRARDKEDYVEKLENRYTDFEVLDHQFIDMDNPYKNVQESYSFESEAVTEMVAGKIYFSPLLHFASKTNPFKLEKRSFPIDYGYPSGTTYRLTLNLPEGYQVESMPESIKINLPEGLGEFTYRLKHVENQIQVVAATKLKRAVFGPNYYLSLKDFYAKMIEKQQEKVVLSKT